MPVTSFSSKLPRTSTSIFSVMSALAREHQAINLSQGFPNFDPPAALRALVSEHMEKGHNQYAPMPGLPQLREVLANKHKESSGLAVNANDQITITSGATEALYVAITTVVKPGDEVITADFTFAATVEVIGLLQLTPVLVDVRQDTFNIDFRFLSYDSVSWFYVFRQNLSLGQG